MENPSFVVGSGATGTQPAEKPPVTHALERAHMSLDSLKQTVDVLRKRVGYVSTPETPSPVPEGEATPDQNPVSGLTSSLWEIGNKVDALQAEIVEINSRLEL